MLLARAALRDMLFNQVGATFVTFIARTEPKLKGGKKNRLHGLQKVANVNGTINWIYENAVNNQRGREAEEGELIEAFEALPRTWGQRLHDALPKRTGGHRVLPWVAHEKGNKEKYANRFRCTLEELQAMPVEDLYLEFKPGTSIEYKYMLNGVEVPAEEAHAEIYVAPNEGQRQEVEEVVRVRDYKLTNIEQITMNNNTFILC